jgi:hypothetical protein
MNTLTLDRQDIHNFVNAHFQVDALITTNNHHVEVPCEGKKLSDLPFHLAEFSAWSGISLCLFSLVPPEKSQDEEKFRLVENGLKGAQFHSRKISTDRKFSEKSMLKGNGNIFFYFLI